MYSSKKLEEFYSRSLSVELIEHYLEMLTVMPLYASDEVLRALHCKMLERLNEISPRVSFPFNVSSVVVTYKNK